MIEPTYEHTTRQRLNKGAQMTQRTETILQIVGEQGALCFDHLQRWYGLLSPASTRMKESGILSTERTRKLIRPWIDRQLLEYKIFYAGQKGWLWLTAKGLKYVNVDLRVYEPAPASLNHLYAVNAIRYLIAVRRPAEIWRSERVLRAQQHARSQAGKYTHLPDAEVISPNGTIKAIECELTVKQEKRLEEIIFDLAANARYNAIWYFVPPQVKGAVSTAIDKLPPEYQTHFSLYSLKGEPYSR